MTLFRDKLRQDVTDYLSKRKSGIMVGQDIDQAIEYFQMQPVLTAMWWKAFVKNGTYDECAVNFVPGKILVPGNTAIQEVESIIERNKLTIIPIDNWLSLSKKRRGFNFRGRVERDLARVAKERMDRVIRMDLQIDGKDVAPSKRIVSPLFSIDVNDSNIEMLQKLEFGSVEPGRYYAISDGSWCFIEPGTLSYGPHTVETLGTCATGFLELHIRHRLRVI